MSVVAIIGAGPRGLSILERLVCNLRTGARDATDADGFEIILIDPQSPGPGQVWRRDQSPLVLMNTPAGSCTIFTDHSVKIDGPIIPGPALAEWSRTIAPSLSDLPDEIRRLAMKIEDDSFAPRVVYGHYLHWAYGEIRRLAPAGVSIRHVQSHAVDMTRTGNTWTIALSDGSALTAGSVVIALGHPIGKAQPARVAGRSYHVSSRNATDADLSVVTAGDTVAVRGLGLCAFDYIALLTQGRGGRYVATAEGRYDYQPSGNEPRLLLGSRRGLPYRGRGRHPVERYQPQVLTHEITNDLAHRTVIDFETDLWPLIAAELIAALGGRTLAIADVSDVGGEAWALLERCSAPLGERSFPDHDAMTRAIVAHLEADLSDADDAASSFRQVQGAMRFARATIREQLSLRRVSARTHGPFLAELRDLLDFSISGPPAHRIAQLLALHSAGIVEFAGPQMSAVPQDSGFLVSSPRVANHVRAANVLIDAWLPSAQTPQPGSLLALQAERGTFSRHSRLIDGPALSVDPKTLAILDPHGTPVDGCHAVGQSIAPQEWVPVIAPLAGTNSRFLRMTDRVARAVLDDLGTRAAPYICPSREDELNYAN